jgi:hypothetical protein
MANNYIKKLSVPLLLFLLLSITSHAQQKYVNLDMMFWIHYELYNTIKKDVLSTGIVEKNDILTISYDNSSSIVIIKALPKTDFKLRPNLISYKGYLKIKDYIFLVRDNLPENIAIKSPIRYPLRISDNNSITSTDGIKEWHFCLKSHCVKLIKKQLQW